MKKFLKNTAQIFGLMLFAMLIAGMSSAANAHSSFEATGAVAFTPAQVDSVKTTADFEQISRSIKQANNQHQKQKKDCKKTCAQTCPPSTCMTGVLSRDVFVFSVFGFIDRLPFRSMRSTYTARAHSLFHPPKS